jgi:thioredoxin reductase
MVMSRSDPLSIAILGAGPVGLEAALYAASLKFPFRVYERGAVGEHLRQWGHVRLFSPFGMNATPLGRATLGAVAPRRELPGDGDILTGREHLAAYLEPLAGSPALVGHIETGVTVLAVGRRGYLKDEGSGDVRRGQQPFRLLLRDASGKERVAEADVVLDCTGTYGQPRYLGDGGIPAVGELAASGQIARGLEDVLGEKRKHYADRTVLVVGGGHSAATTVCLLAQLARQTPSTWIVWLARRAGSQPIRRVMNDPLRERDQVAARANMLATRGEGHVEFHAQSIVQEIESYGDEGFVVRALCGPEERSWEVDRVIANVGYQPDDDLYRELHVSVQAGSLRQVEPNFYILGSKSHGRNAMFLLRNGFEQVRDVFALIAGKRDLDLYKKVRS